jgi:hypothetical protein
MNCLQGDVSAPQKRRVSLNFKSFGVFPNIAENHCWVIRMVISARYSLGGFGGNFWRWAAPATVLPWGTLSV